MKYMSHNDIRVKWFDFFTKHQHKVYESAPLVPIDDDSLLWINAGVTPLKKYFDGSEVPDSRRIVNIQKCIRTNDIDNVGVTKFINSFKVFAPIEIMTNGGPMGSSRVLSYWIYKVGRVGYNYGMAMAGAIVLTIIVGGFTIFNYRFFANKSKK